MFLTVDVDMHSKRNHYKIESNLMIVCQFVKMYIQDKMQQKQVITSEKVCKSVRERCRF